MTEKWWSPYVSLEIQDAAFSNLVAASLDQISVTPEGKEIIIKAYNNSIAAAAEIKNANIPTILGGERARNKDGKIRISELPLSLLSAEAGPHALPALGYIQLPSKDMGAIGFKTVEGSVEPMNVTDILVHEFFHQADPHLHGAGLQRMAADQMRIGIMMVDTGIDVPSDQSLPLEERLVKKKTIMKTAIALQLEDSFPDAKKNMSDQEWVQYTSSDPEKLKKVIIAAQQATMQPETLNHLKDRIAERTGMAADSFNFQPLDFKKIEEQAKLLSFAHPETGAPVVEELATRYTDAFMGKYFSAPARGRFSNATRLEKVSRNGEQSSVPPTVHDFLCGEMPTLVYEHADPALIGDLPKISPIPCKEVITQAAQKDVRQQ